VRLLIDAVLCPIEHNDVFFSEETQFTMSSREKTAVCIVLLFLLTVIYFAPIVFSSKTFISRDHYTFFNPRRFFAAECITQGTLPLWNPYIACGVPFQANLQSSVFYPPSLLYYVLPFQKGFKYFVVLHYFIGALCMFFLMRQWKSTRWEALLAGMVFAFGGYLVSINDNVAFLTAGVWLPLVLLCHHRMLTAGSLFYCIVTGMVIGLQIFAGDVSFYLLSSLICTLVYTLLWPYIREEADTYGVVKRWGLFCTSWAIGFLLAAVQILPFVEFVLHSTRTVGLSFEGVTRWSFHPLELLQFIVPYVFGSLVPQTRWFGQLWLDTVYIGVVPLVFAVVYIVRGTAKIKYFLITLFLVSIFLSFGKYNPVFKYLFWFVPGINLLQIPVKLFFITGFVLAAMAGKGAGCFRQVCENTQKAKYFLILLLLPVTALAVLLVSSSFWGDELYRLFYAVYPYKKQYFLRAHFFALFKDISIVLILLVVLALLTLALVKKKGRQIVFTAVVVLVFLDLAVVGKPQDDSVDESVFAQTPRSINLLNRDTSLYRVYSLSPATTKTQFMHFYYLSFENLYGFLTEVLVPNLNIYHHVYSVQEYSALFNKRYFKLFDPARVYFREAQEAPLLVNYTNRLFDLLNVKYIVSTAAVPEFNFKLISDDPVFIYENPTVLPRAFFIQNLFVLKDDAAVINMIHKETFDPRNMVYITEKEIKKISTELFAGQDESTEDHFEGSVDIVDHTPNRISMMTATNQFGFLVLSESFYPGWKAFVDGKEVPVMRVNHVLRGILVAEGEHEIVFVFRPMIFVIGSIISAAVCACLCGCLFLLRKQRNALDVGRVAAC